MGAAPLPWVGLRRNISVVWDVMEKRMFAMQNEGRVLYRLRLAWRIAPEPFALIDQ